MLSLTLTRVAFSQDTVRRKKNTDVHREALESCFEHTNMKYVSNKSGTRSFLKVSILIHLGIVTFLISEYRGTFEVSVHRATLLGGAGCYWVVLVLLGGAGCYWVVLGVTGWCWLLLGGTGWWRASPLTRALCAVPRAERCSENRSGPTLV